jgi:hypothetical protein
LVQNLKLEKIERVFSVQSEKFLVKKGKREKVFKVLLKTSGIAFPSEPLGKGQRSVGSRIVR